MVRINIYKRRLKKGKLGGEVALPDKDVQSRGDSRYLGLRWAPAQCSGGCGGRQVGGEGTQAALLRPVDHCEDFTSVRRCGAEMCSDHSNKILLSAVLKVVRSGAGPDQREQSGVCCNNPGKKRP